jgi:hypothetical protein
VGVA